VASPDGRLRPTQAAAVKEILHQLVTDQRTLEVGVFIDYTLYNIPYILYPIGVLSVPPVWCQSPRTPGEAKGFRIPPANGPHTVWV
jgi:hypothetical protein